MPNKDKNKIRLLIINPPIEIKISPTKFMVPGKPKLDKIKIKYKTEYNGIKVTIPQNKKVI